MPRTFFFRRIFSLNPGAACALSCIGIAAALTLGCTSATTDKGGTSPLTTSMTPAVSADLVTDDVRIVQSAYRPTTPDSDPQQNYGVLYLPPGRQAPDTFPLVILVHGGGWAATTGAGVLNDYSRMLAERGIAVYNIEYRRTGAGGGYPQTFADVAAAFNHVPVLQKRFAQLTRDPQRVIGVGHSAGAQLAVFAATAQRPSAALPTPERQFRPGTVISLAGPLDMADTVLRGNPRARKAMGGPPQELAQRYSAVDPIENINPAISVVLLHGDRDDVVPLTMSLRYAAAVQRAGGVAEMTIVPGGDHVSIVRPGGIGYRMVVDTIVRKAYATG